MYKLLIFRQSHCYKLFKLLSADTTARRELACGNASCFGT